MSQQGPSIPYLKEQGSCKQLIVNEKPFLILGGELGNSSASDTAYIDKIWPKLNLLNLNTVLAPVYWELIEPEENIYDFSLVDNLIFGARKHNLKLVILWFGSWKNSMSCYAPMWVKKNLSRFPRSMDANGNSVNILSAFSDDVLNADIKVFTALMAHIKTIDSKQQTVLMIQVENEIGMLPEPRDMSFEATKLFKTKVPASLMSYIVTHKDSLHHSLRKRWESSGFKTDGNWEEIFSKSMETEEYFMAWYYAVFAEKLTKAGKAVYPLPMYVNAALNKPNFKPGQYPSAGPLPHLMDIWKAAAPNIDFLAADIYFPDFELWSNRYKRYDNLSFIPENQLGFFNGANALYVIGGLDAIGYSPFSVESIEDPQKSTLANSYEILSQLSPLILEKQGKNLTAGILLDSINEKAQVKLNGYILNFRHEKDWLKPSQPIAMDQQKAGCLIIATGPDEFIVAGNSILITFTPDSQELPIAGIGAIDEVQFVNGKIKHGRRLNGDQNHQGRHVHLTSDKFGIQKVTLYKYK